MLSSHPWRPALQRASDRGAAVGHDRELALAAKTGLLWSARKFPCWTVFDDWFMAANLDSALARPGHRSSLLRWSAWGQQARSHRHESGCAGNRDDRWTHLAVAAVQQVTVARSAV